MNNAKTVDEYISSIPIKYQQKLKQLRLIIKSIVPDAKERISYGMPFYEYKGRLVYFGIAKNHIGLYIPPPIIQQYADDLKGFFVTKSAVHLSLEKDLPENLIKKLVRARMSWNEKHS